MTRQEFEAAYELLAEGDEFLEFDRIPNPRHAQRPDLAAFLLLDDLVPGKGSIIASASHDEYWLSTDIDKLAAAATEADLLTLYRCGIRYDSGVESLAVFT